MNFEIDKKLLTQMIYFTVMVIFGLVVWLVITNILMPPAVSINKDLSALTRVTVDPTLETDAIAQMQNKRYFSAGDLAAFSVYLEDSESNRTGQELLIRRAEPLEPLDLGYYLVNSNSGAR